MAPIKESFSDLESYSQAFKWPLLEDTRSQLQESLENIGSKPWIPIESIVEMKSSKDKNKTNLRTFNLVMKVGSDFVDRDDKDKPGRVPEDAAALVQPRSSKKEIKSQLRRDRSVVERDKDAQWTPRSKELALLTTLVPENLEAEDFQKNGALYSLVEVDVANDSPSFKVKAYMHDESPEYLHILRREKTSWYLVFLNTLATQIRIWEALSTAKDPESEKTSRKVAEEILCSTNIQVTLAHATMTLAVLSLRLYQVILPIMQRRSHQQKSSVLQCIVPASR